MNATVIHNKEAAPGYYKIALRWKGSRKAIRPGEFVMVRVADALDPLLRRPFSIYNVLPAGRGIELLYKVVGRGTSIMAALNPGDGIDVLGPLGDRFPDVKDPSRLIMVAGGIGIAPFYLLSKGLKSKKKPLLLFGARGRVDAALTRGIGKLGVRVKVMTEDGSVGAKGLVTDLLKKSLKDDSIVYACGPMEMLKAVAKLTEDRGVRCYVSLERSMACGIGVCLGCAVKTKPHPGKPVNKVYEMVCTDGPVFKSEEIEWQSL